MDQTKDIGSEIMMVQLLFKSKPNSPTTEQFRKALEKRFGDLGEIPYVEPSKKSSGDMFMFPIPKYKAFFKDKPSYQQQLNLALTLMIWLGSRCGMSPTLVK